MKRFSPTINPLILIVGAYLILGLVYSTTIPLFEAPDEQLHFAFVQYLATGHGLPIQTLGQPAHLARQEGSQPPLYYFLAAGATFWIDTSDFPGIIWENPHYGFDVPGIVNDNKNLFIHTAAEDFPYHGAALAIHLARLISLLLGATAIVFTYLLTLEILPDKNILAYSSAAMVAFVPQFLLVSSAVSNDSAIVALSAFSLWMIVRMFQVSPGLGSVVGIGAAVGLASLAKVSGLGLVLLGFIGLMVVTWKDPRKMAMYSSVMLMSFALVGGWWYLRNWLLYGEFTGTEMMLHIFGARQTPLTTSQMLAQLGEVWETFWIGFGWGNIRAQPAVYNLLAVVVLIGIFGLVVLIARRRKSPVGNLPSLFPVGTLLVWAIMVFAEFFRWMMVTQAPHGRLLFPALPAVMPLFGIGLSSLAPGKYRFVPAPIFASVLFLLAAVSPQLLLAPAYAYPEQLLGSNIGNIVNNVDITYGDKIRLLRYDVFPPRAQPGGAIQLDLYWQCLAPMDRDYTIGIHLLDGKMNVISGRDSYPGHGLLPTTLWYQGEIIRDDYWVPISTETTAPSLAQIQISLYDRADQTELEPVDPLGQTITPIVGRFAISLSNPQTVRIENPTKYTFGNAIVLSGYNLRSISPLDMTLVWDQIAPVSLDYTVFVHVLDFDHRIVAQLDRQPLGGAYPTSLWGKGERVYDPYTLQVPMTSVYIELGLYRPDSGVRLPVVDQSGLSLGDHIELTMPKR